MGKAFQKNLAQFTRREQEILFYIADDLSSKEIADILFISKNTVDTHRRNILKKRLHNKASQYQLK